jgi:hypothetical protein
MVQMEGLRATQKNGSWVGWVGMVGVEEHMVHFTPFPLIIYFLLFLLLKFWMCMNMCVLSYIYGKTPYIERDPNKIWKG